MSISYMGVSSPLENLALEFLFLLTDLSKGSDSTWRNTMLLFALSLSLSLSLSVRVSVCVCLSLCLCLYLSVSVCVRARVCGYVS